MKMAESEEQDLKSTTVTMTGITGGSVQTLTMTGIDNRRTYISQHDDASHLQHLKELIVEDIDMHTEGIIRTRDVEDVITKIQSGQKWITITGNPGEGKTTLGYSVLKEMEKKGKNVFVIEKPEEYYVIIRQQKNVVFLLDDILGAFTFDSAKLGDWEKVIKRIVKKHERSAGKDQEDVPIVLLTCRRNVLERAKRSLGSLDVICEKSHVVDLSSKEREQERCQILNCYLKRLERQFSKSEKEEVASTGTPHGFPHCCKLYVDLVKKGEEIDLVEFFKGPLRFLEKTTTALFENSSYKTLFQFMLKHDGKFDIASVEDSLRSEMISASGELMHSYLQKTRRNLIEFSHPSIYESFLFVTGERDPIFIVKHTSLSVIRQKVNIRREGTMDLKGCINLDPDPEILNILCERFQPFILQKNYNIFRIPRLTGCKGLCESLVHRTVRESRFSLQGLFQKDKKSVFINAKDTFGDTMMTAAVESDNDCAVFVLLHHGAEMIRATSTALTRL